MATPLHRVIIFVGDVLKCSQFYCDMFGFKPVETPTAQWTELETGGCRLALHLARGTAGPVGKPTGSADHPHKLVFHAEDVAAERARLIERGVAMGKMHTFGPISMCDGADPEGHAFQLSSRR